MTKPRGLLEKAEAFANKTIESSLNQVQQRANELALETRQESREEISEVSDSDMDAVKAALRSTLLRRDSSSAIALDSGKIIPGTASETREEKIKRVTSGAPSLDGAIGGGFVEESLNLVTGSPGAGKTIFAAQFIASGIEAGEPGLYISFEEKKEMFYKYMLQLGWDFEKYEAEGKFTFLRYSPEQVQSFLSEGLGAVEEVIRSRGVKRLCIDSISAFTMLFKDELSARESLLAMFERLNALKITSLITAEHETKMPASSVVEFEADSIIALSNFRKKNVRQRVAEIIKMRGTQFTEQVFPVKIGDGGLAFYPDESAF